MKSKLILSFLTVLLLSASFPGLIFAQEVVTKTQSQITKVAPGESLPIEVRLVNFGSRRRVDVTILYQILDQSENLVVEGSETVAVETTANFIKEIQLPSDLIGGIYKARSILNYPDQEAPAVSSFQFSVERRVFGLFLTEAMYYLAVLVGVSFLLVTIARLLIKRMRHSRLTPHDYSDIPDDKRVFYELIGDTILQMRSHVGDEAIQIAVEVPGLEVDENNGKVLSLTREPAQVMAELVSEYEQKLGRKVNFALGSKREQSKVIVRK